ncbi:hypothetical protein SSX86_024289 [Deinandra increscens subsp. villosa]|uniref:Uncharacterized protein n=1 Tax=Deinandra increscens subsp. villosa TaxID=3103831 RepID=A0AAP0GQG1_9ASTR
MVKRDPRLVAATLELETIAAAARAAAATERAAATTAAAAARAAVAADIFGEDHREVVLALPAPPRPLFEPSRAVTVEPGENPKWPAPLYAAAVTPLPPPPPRETNEIISMTDSSSSTVEPFDWNGMIHSMVSLPPPPPVHEMNAPVVPEMPSSKSVEDLTRRFESGVTVCPSASSSNPGVSNGCSDSAKVYLIRLDY